MDAFVPSGVHTLRKALFTDPQGSERHRHEYTLTELKIAQHNAIFDDQARDNVIFYSLLFLCFVRAFSKMRWCWWSAAEVPRHDAPRFGRGSRSGIDWDRVIASLLVALSDGSAVAFNLILLGHICVKSFTTQPWQHTHSMDLLFSGLWYKITICTNLSLFLALPLAFFLDEASGVFGPSTHHRLLESLLVLCAVSAVWTTLFYLAYLWTGHTDLFIPFLRSSAGGIGSLLFLACTPVGFGRMVSWSWSLWRPVSFKPRALVVESVDLMVRSLEDKEHLAAAEHSPKLPGIRRELRELERRRSMVAGSGPLQILIWDLAFVLLFPAAFVMAILTLVRLVTNQIYWLLAMLLPLQLLEVGLRVQEQIGICHWGICTEFVYDAALMLYFVTATFAGFEALTRHQKRWSALDSWAVGAVVLRSGAKLLLSCSVPVAVRLLDLEQMQQLEIEKYLGVNVWFQNQLVLQAYRIMFLCAAAYRVVYLPPFQAVWLYLVRNWVKWRSKR